MKFAASSPAPEILRRNCLRVCLIEGCILSIAVIMASSKVVVAAIKTTTSNVAPIAEQ